MLLEVGVARFPDGDEVGQGGDADGAFLQAQNPSVPSESSLLAGFDTHILDFSGDYGGLSFVTSHFQCIDYLCF